MSSVQLLYLCTLCLYYREKQEMKGQRDRAQHATKVPGGLGHVMVDG